MFVGSEAETVSSPVGMFSAPTSNAPTLPVRRATAMGTMRPSSNPIFWLQKSCGTLTSAKIPQNSRFSGT